MEANLSAQTATPPTQTDHTIPTVIIIISIYEYSPLLSPASALLERENLTLLNDKNGALLLSLLGHTDTNAILKNQNTRVKPAAGRKSSPAIVHRALHAA